MSRRIPHVEGLPGDAEDIGGSALEHDQVAIVGARNNHFDAGLCPVQGVQLDLVPATEQSVAVCGFAQKIDAGLTVRANGIVGEVGNDHIEADMDIVDQAQDA